MQHFRPNPNENCHVNGVSLKRFQVRRPGAYVTKFECAICPRQAPEEIHRRRESTIPARVNYRVHRIAQWSRLHRLVESTTRMPVVVADVGVQAHGCWTSVSQEKAQTLFVTGLPHVMFCVSSCLPLSNVTSQH